MSKNLNQNKRKFFKNQTEINYFEVKDEIIGYNCC